MRRTTVFLEEDLQRELSALAKKQARPAAVLVREAIGQYVALRKAASPRVLSFVGVGGSGRSDTAETHEELLFKDLHPGPVGDIGGVHRTAARSKLKRSTRGSRKTARRK